MAVKNLLVIAVIAFFTFNYLSNVKAQDTFGPVCDDVTVTCAPTMSPTPGSETPTPIPSTETPTPIPPTPTELPRAGTTENLRNIILISILLIFTGAASQFVLSSQKSQ